MSNSRRVESLKRAAIVVQAARTVWAEDEAQDLAEYALALFVIGVIGLYVTAAIPSVERWRNPPVNVTVTPAEPARKAEAGGLAAIDELLRQLPSANIAFSAPESMYVDGTADVELKLSPTHSIDELKKMIEAEGAKEGATIKVSDRMEAHLSGSGFRVEYIADTAETAQAVSAAEPTTWKWRSE